MKACTGRGGGRKDTCDHGLSLPTRSLRVKATSYEFSCRVKCDDRKHPKKKTVVHSEKALTPSSSSTSSIRPSKITNGSLENRCAICFERACPDKQTGTGDRDAGKGTRGQGIGDANTGIGDANTGIGGANTGWGAQTLGWRTQTGG